jgi:flagellar motility protein MotE (MotC chaperone)
MIATFEGQRKVGSLLGVEEASHIATEVSKLGETNETIVSDSVNALAGLETVLGTSIASIEKRNAPLDDEYQKEFAALSVDEQAVLSERNRVVQEIAGLASLRAEQSSRWAEIQKPLEELAQAYDEIQTSLRKRSDRRATIAREINAELEKSKIGTRLQFNPNARLDGRLPVGTNSSNAYESLASEYRSLNEETISRNISLTSTIPESEPLFSIDDGMGIQFEIYPDTWKPASDLSAGQKSTAVLPLLLMAARGPIILDQPEDNLDNKYIGASVVRMILERKRQSQVVITSHSASIVVMSDSELIVEMTDQANRGTVKEAGFLSGPESRVAGSVLEVLDGGRDALLARFKKYGRLMK